MEYMASSNRYDQMVYRRCGLSGLKLPVISLGLWHNFGGVDVFENGRAIVWKSFDAGITHFDLANNYGPPPGSAESFFGTVLSKDLKPYRDELIVSTKAGYGMWPGPYGEWGSKKYLIASLDQSLKRMGLEYVDIFYSHRPDPETPFEETMEALYQIVRQGKALYVGLSNYSATQTKEAVVILKSMGIRPLIHQPRYSMLDRWSEQGLYDVLGTEGMGAIAFSPLAQGMLTNRYLEGIPSDSRVAKSHGFLKEKDVTTERIDQIQKLNVIAIRRNQTLAQMALCWVLREDRVTSVLIGVSKLSQLEDNLGILKNLNFSADELGEIEGIIGK